jgi:hypothetical protein
VKWGLDDMRVSGSFISAGRKSFKGDDFSFQVNLVKETQHSRYFFLPPHLPLRIGFSVFGEKKKKKTEREGERDKLMRFLIAPLLLSGITLG